jgi:hypothetical protein
VARVLANVDDGLGDALRLVDYDNNFALDGGGPQFDAYFEVDQDFRPSFVEYRRHARAAIKASDKREDAPDALETTSAGPGDRGGSSSGGRTFGQVLVSGSGDSPRLPFPITSSRRGAARGARIEDGKLAVGRLSGSRPELEGSASGRMREFWVPEGRRMVQVRYKPREARTVVGDVFRFVGGVTNQYRIVDSSAETYNLAGYYAIIERNGEEYMELFYAGDPDDPQAVAFRGMLDFQAVQRSELNDQEDAVIGLLFLVPPNKQFVKVENQTGDGGDISIRSRP